MLIIMEVFSLFFRETIILSRDYFKNVLSLRDFHYKVSNLCHTDSGTQVRKVKDHIGCEVVVTKGRYKLIQYVGVGKRYS